MKYGDQSLVPDLGRERTSTEPGSAGQPAAARRAHGRKRRPDFDQLEGYQLHHQHAPCARAACSAKTSDGLQDPVKWQCRNAIEILASALVGPPQGDTMFFAIFVPAVGSPIRLTSYETSDPPVTSILYPSARNPVSSNRWHQPCFGCRRPERKQRIPTDSDHPRL
jgi:hypothetical protein